MKAVCPKNPKHKKFVTTAHVMQEWVVDEHGEFIKVARNGECLEVVADPDPGNDWTCYVCGAEAKVRKDETQYEEED